MGNYVLYNGELYHYGVKGMKWGVSKVRKRDKLTFSEKKTLRKIASDHGGTIKSLGGRKTEQYNSIGPNSRRAISNRRKAVDNSKSSKELDSYLTEWYKNNPKRLPVNEEKYKTLVENVTANNKRIIESYIDVMMDSYIADVNIRTTQKGKDYLRKLLK